MVDKAIQELRDQIVKISPKGGPINPGTLTRAVTALNVTIRKSRCSAKELWLSRDQISGENLHLDDHKLSQEQFQARQNSHASSAAYSSRLGKPVSLSPINVRDTIFIKSDRSKSKAVPPNSKSGHKLPLPVLENSPPTYHQPVNFRAPVYTPESDSDSADESPTGK